ncbi:glycoside hydrolase family 3 N-terminal domain-containing protein [Vibrio breoganii]
MTHPYQNPKLSIQERTDDLLSRMTVEEKVGQMLQLPAHDQIHVDNLEAMNVGSYLHCTGEQPQQLQDRAANTRLGIPLIFGIDAIHGHCFEDDATVFPTQLSASCSWDKSLMERMAQVTAFETRASGQHWTFSPVLCVGRDPRWGRVDETYGEDPWLIGELAASTIVGYQGNDFSSENSILACAKHYVGYGETLGGRDSYEADTSRRKLLSLFLPPFEKAVKQANCATLMTGYQAIDGEPCTTNSWLLKTVAKEQWGLDGFIVTDWNNVGSLHDKQGVAATLKEASYKALLGGNDMMMTTPEFYQSAIELVEEGLVDISLIDDSVRRILEAKFKLGLFDENRYTSLERKKLLGSDDSWEISLEASRKSLVLLKNEDVLPLSANNIKKVLVVGPNADDIIAQLGDWSFGSMQAEATHENYHRGHTITPLAALQKMGQEQGFEVEYIKGADCLDSNFEEIDKARFAAESADVVIACVGDTLKQNGEFHDRANLDLSGYQNELIEAVSQTGTPVVGVLVASKPLTIPKMVEQCSAVISAFNPGCKGGQALAELVFGQYNPSGKLTISFPHHVGQVPVYYNKFKGWHALLEADLDNQERYIDMPETPLFAFGEGISYTQYEYSDLHIENPALSAGEDLRFSIKVSNVGKQDGVEIVQAYFNDLFSSVTTEIKSLRAFERITLKAGESKVVNMTIVFDDLALINSALERVVEPGDFELMVGASSKDSDLIKANFKVVA